MQKFLKKLQSILLPAKTPHIERWHQTTFPFLTEINH